MRKYVWQVKEIIPCKIKPCMWNEWDMRSKTDQFLASWESVSPRVTAGFVVL